jgi:Protein of unknown function (DUF1153)
MIVLTDDRTASAKAPDRKPIPEEVSHAAPLAAYLVAAVEDGCLTLDEAWSRFHITPEAIAMWQRARDGVDLLHGARRPALSKLARS